MTAQFSLIGHSLTGYLDKINDRITSYRLMLYFLLALVCWAILGSFFNKVPFSWHAILVSAIWLVALCWVVNKVVSRFLNTPINQESALISGLILALILSPADSGKGFAVLGAAAVAAMVSKYILAIYKSHILNPAATGALVAGEVFGHYATWWVGTTFITPIVIAGGILVLRKMNRYMMAILFLAVYLVYLGLFTSAGANPHQLWLGLISTQVIFFAVVMLTEPLTSPTTVYKSLAYAALVAILYSVAALHLSPEAALLIGNTFNLIVAANRRYSLAYRGRRSEATGIYSYTFAKPQKLNFQAGQYMEWTVGLASSDSRGNRRYFTIASAPTEPQITFTLKQPDKPSAFKRRLAELKQTDRILAAQLAGHFTLPADQTKKLAFLAGGVGITPFRSMVKYLLDRRQKRDMALIYTVANPDEIAFKKLFEQAGVVGLKSHFLVGERLDEARLKQLLPDFKQRVFYVSGPLGFVQAMKQVLTKLGMPQRRIVTDYFPGYD